MRQGTRRERKEAGKCRGGGRKEGEHRKDTDRKEGNELLHRLRLLSYPQQMKEVSCY